MLYRATSKLLRQNLTPSFKKFFQIPVEQKSAASNHDQCRYHVVKGIFGCLRMSEAELLKTAAVKAGLRTDAHIKIINITNTTISLDKLK